MNVLYIHSGIFIRSRKFSETVSMERETEDAYKELVFLRNLNELTNKSASVSFLYTAFGKDGKVKPFCYVRYLAHMYTFQCHGLSF